MFGASALDKLMTGPRPRSVPPLAGLFHTTTSGRVLRAPSWSVCPTSIPAKGEGSQPAGTASTCTFLENASTRCLSTWLSPSTQ
jgi:hypothetical protein